MTAFTDSDEEETSSPEPTNKLVDLLKEIDRLHHGTESDKRKSLDVLLEHRDEVTCLTVLIFPFFL